MAPISESIEINRSPEEVFAYLEVKRHGEWQEQIVDVQPQLGPARTHQHARVTTLEPLRSGRLAQAAFTAETPTSIRTFIGPKSSSPWPSKATR